MNAQQRSSFNIGSGAILPLLDAGKNTLETKPRVTHDTKVSRRNKTIDTGYTTYCFLPIGCLFVARELVCNHGVTNMKNLFHSSPSCHFDTSLVPFRTNRARKTAIFNGDDLEIIESHWHAKKGMFWFCFKVMNPIQNFCWEQWRMQ